jgi:hypothetical protein
MFLMKKSKINFSKKSIEIKFIFFRKTFKKNFLKKKSKYKPDLKKFLKKSKNM